MLLSGCRSLAQLKGLQMTEPRSKTCPWIEFAGTLISACVGLTLLCVTLLLDLDLFELALNRVSHLHFEAHELDEFVIPIVLVLAGGMFDLVSHHFREKRNHQLHADRLRTMRVTMASVDDVINNLLNNLEFLKFNSSQYKVLDEGTVALLNDQIKEAQRKLNQIKELDAVVEQDLGQGIRCLKINDEDK